MKDDHFNWLSKATYALGTLHTMLGSSIDPSILRDIDFINKKIFMKPTRGYEVFMSLYRKEIKEDNLDKKSHVINKIVREIWLHQFDDEMREKFEALGKLESVVTKEARVDTEMEILQIHNKKLTKKKSTKIKSSKKN